MMKKFGEFLPIDRFKVPKFLALISVLSMNMSIGVINIRFPEFGLSGYLAVLARANNQQNFALLLCDVKEKFHPGAEVKAARVKQFHFKKELQIPVVGQRGLEISEAERDLVISEAVKKILSAHQIKPHLPDPSFDDSVNTIIPFFQTDSFWDEIQKELEVQAEEGFISSLAKPRFVGIIRCNRINLCAALHLSIAPPPKFYLQFYRAPTAVPSVTFIFERPELRIPREWTSGHNDLRETKWRDERRRSPLAKQGNDCKEFKQGTEGMLRQSYEVPGVGLLSLVPLFSTSRRITQLDHINILSKIVLPQSSSVMTQVQFQPTPFTVHPKLSRSIEEILNREINKSIPEGLTFAEGEAISFLLPGLQADRFWDELQGELDREE